MKSVNDTIAWTTLISVVAITIGDAPQWRVEPYVGLLAAMSGVAVIARSSPALAQGFAGLITAVMILNRAERLTTVVVGQFGGTTNR